MRRHAAALAALLTCAAVTVRGEQALDFESGVPGTTSGSALAPDVPACEVRALDVPLDRGGDASLSAGTNALRPAEGARFLRLSTGAGGDLALTRWEAVVTVREPSLLTLRHAFATSDRADFRDGWLLLLDGRPLACGDALSMQAAGSAGFADGDRWTGWSPAVAPVDAGVHVLVAYAWDGADSDGESSLLLDAVRVEPLGQGQDCRPAPPEDVGESVAATSTTTRWTFDDNRFCSDGPGIGCSRPPDGDPRPGTDFVDSTGLSFEMYIVADCGTEMHIPLNDVEGGCISVFDEDRNPIAIQVTNNDGFNQAGGEVCWNAEFCDGQGLNLPGGPGNERVMDVSFQGNPTLCGVYIVNFRSWAGCFWDLFANCNGTGTPQFDIYDDFCEAQAAVQPLPEIVIQGLVLSDGGSCSVDYCVTVRNIGCLLATAHDIRVTNIHETDLLPIPSLEAGATIVLCGNLDVPDTGATVATVVTATADANNVLTECSEVPNASSCTPSTGANVATRVATVACDQEPTCDAGGPYQATCTTDGATVALDGSGSTDPDGAPLQYAWSTTCPGATVSGSASSPFATLDLAGGSCGSCSVTLTVTDSAGETATCQAGVTVVDTTAPDLTCPASQVVECPEAPGARDAWVASATATDDCSGVVITATLVSSVPGCAGPTETWRWEAEDSCSPFSDSCTATWTRIDTTPPVVTPPDPGEVECGTPGGFAAFAAWLASATAADACAGALPVTTEIVSVQVPCPGTTITTYRFAAIDPCGNAADAVSTWTVRDTLPPTLSAMPADVDVACHAVPPPAVLTASDICDPDVPVVFTETRANGSCPDRYSLTRTWTATDDCGNSTSWTQLVRVGDDVAPTLSGVPGDTTVQCTSVPPPASPSASDNCDPDPDVVFVESVIAGDCPQERTIQRSWTATDRCGNSRTSVQVITVVDTMPPVLSAMPADVDVACHAVPPPAVLTAADACDPDVPVTFTEMRSNGACPDRYSLTRTWTATDDCGNTTTWTQLVRVGDDAAPTFAGVPPDETVECTAVPPPATPTATDNCDPDPDIVFVENVIAGDCPQERTIQRFWTATDRCGNSRTVVQVVTVVDTVPPVLAGVPADETVQCDAVPPPAEPTATDACDPAPVVAFAEVRVDGALAAEADGSRSWTRRVSRDASALGTVACEDAYELHRTWTATDACGNATSRTQVVTVVDTVAPTLSGVPPDVTVSCDAVPPPATPSSADNCDPDPEIAFAETRTDGDCADTYTLTRTWTATDRCGNAATATQVVQVQDVTAPAISGVPADEVVECDAVPPPASPTAADACDPAPVVTLAEVVTAGPCPNRWTITRTWTATDRCGNAVSATQVLQVVDTTPPQLSAPDDLTVECPEPQSGPQSEAGWLASASATDNCGPAQVVTQLLSDVPGCGATRVATWEIWAVDACGLESPHVQRVYTVVDTTPPTVAPPDDLTVECPAPGSGPQSEAAWIASATGADACGDVTVHHELVESIDGCGATFTHVYEFWTSDACGLESPRETRTYRVQDTTPPAFGGGDPLFEMSIWPPNHGYVVYGVDEVAAAMDACGAVTLRVTGCTSSQPEEVHQGQTEDGGNGDGHFGEDCVVSADGTAFAVRAERLAACGPDSRRVYGIAVVATDECGNATPGVGNVVVEHDRRTHQPVRRGRKLGPNDPPPWPYIHPTVYGNGC